MNKQVLIKNLKDFRNSYPDNGRHDGVRQGLLIAIGAIENLDEPKKVVIPKFVAEWYEENEGDLEFSVFNLVTTLSEKDYYELTELEAWFNNFRNEPIETIIKMKLFGYEVEEEQKYYVDLDTAAYVAKWNGDNQVGIYTDSVFGNDEFEFHLTEKEIKNYDERFWPFAVEVEE